MEFDIIPSEIINILPELDKMRKFFYISMLGSFEISYYNEKITENLNRSKKMWNLLGYMLIHKDRHVSQEEYIDLLWPNGISNNPVNALKTLLYRLRSLLDSLATKEKEAFILSSKGSYYWNPNIAFTLDTEIFEYLCQQGDRKDLSPQERIAIFKLASDIYKGDFLTKHANELWVLSLSANYHNLYINMMKTFLCLLEEQQLYEEMNFYCARAIQIDSFEEELHCFFIRSLIKQNNYNAALNHYETATNALYQNLGVKPSSKLRNLYLEIINTQKTLEMDLEIIQNDLMEAEFNSGAFVCEYGIFQEAYRLISRQTSRDGRSVFIALITVSDFNGEIPPLKTLNTTMKRLLETIVSCLRRGDVVSQYSGAQYVILLPCVTYEDGCFVLDRIIKTFHQNNRRNTLFVRYKLRQMETPLSLSDSGAV